MWAWVLENGAHLYGTIVPLAQRFDPDYALMKVGSQFVMVDFERDKYCVVGGAASAQEIIERFEGFGFKDLQLTRYKRADRTVAYEQHSYKCTRFFEWNQGKGWNRWQELADRGCDVNPYWLDVRLSGNLGTIPLMRVAESDKLVPLLGLPSDSDDSSSEDIVDLELRK